jgi:hypothetical protein
MASTCYFKCLGNARGFGQGRDYSGKIGRAELSNLNLLATLTDFFSRFVSPGYGGPTDQQGIPLARLS